MALLAGGLGRLTVTGRLSAAPGRLASTPGDPSHHDASDRVPSHDPHLPDAQPMTVLYDLVVGLLLGSLAWLAMVLAIGLVPAAAARLLPDPPAHQTALRGALVGALLAVGIADRLGLPDPTALLVAGRRLIPLWALAGAVAGVASTVISRRVRRQAPPVAGG